MLERHGRGEVDDRRLRLGDRQPLVDPRLELGQVVAGLRGARLLKATMLAAVDHFLGGEGLDLLGQLGRRAVAEGAHALDEKGLALGKGGGQRVVDGGRDGIAAVPPARRSRRRGRSAGRAA